MERVSMKMAESCPKGSTTLWVKEKLPGTADT